MPGGLVAQDIGSLPQRPPTPPRESDNSEFRSSFLGLGRLFFRQSGSYTPPDNSPSSSAEFAKETHDRSQKKVEWSASTEYKEHIIPSSRASHKRLRPLPPSNGKPTKSILKPYNGVVAFEPQSATKKLSSPHTFLNFAIMLESVVKQLAGSDRNSRIDAYVTLNGVLKAAGNIPDSNALKAKLGLITQFIQRDISAKTASGSFDTVIVNHALTLLASLLWKHEIAECFNTEFCTEMIEHAIAAFEGSSYSKDVVKVLLFVIGQQSFSSRVMTTERAGRLLAALQDIERRFRGRSIVLGRITIYRKLLKQARQSLLINTGWIECLFSDLISGINEIRSEAVAFGLEAAFQLGTEKQASRAVMDVFDNKSDNETRYIDHYTKRLGSMVRRKQDGSTVPQIWSIVVLFFRCRPHQLEQWAYIKSWLHVIQECFNYNDHDVKRQANLAWNRFVFSVRPDENTTPSMIKMLCQPLSGQLKRKTVGKHAEEARQATIGSLTNLLYYAFRPNASSAQIDLYWDEYVVQLIGNMLILRNSVHTELAKENFRQACSILQALFDTSTPRPWIENRICEATPIPAQNIPGIDPRWIRRNGQRVFRVLAALLETCYWEIANVGSPIFAVWQTFVSSIALAGAKEVIVSKDTMTTVAYSLNMLCELWHKGLGGLKAANNGDSAQFLKSFSKLVVTLVNSIGILPFTDKLLAISQDETFSLVTTPSSHHNPSKVLGDVKCPLYHLVLLVAQPATDLDCDGNYTLMITEILRPFFESGISRSKWSRIEQAREISHLVGTFPSSPAGIAIWQVVAKFAVGIIASTEKNSSSSSGSHDRPLGVEYRHVVRILEVGIRLSPTEPLKAWHALFDAIASQITLEAGDGGRAISLIDPLAEVLLSVLAETPNVTGLPFCVLLLDSASYPRERQTLDAARRRIWGTGNVVQKSASFDPYSHLYNYVNQCLLYLYKSLASDAIAPCTAFLSATADLLQRCPTIHLSNVLLNLQKGISPWIQDEGLKLKSQLMSALFEPLLRLWESVCYSIERLPRAHNEFLSASQELLCAGLESKHKAIVTAAVTLWNKTFGSEDVLNYPPGLEVALRRLRRVADLRLPAFPNSFEDEVQDIALSSAFPDDSQHEDSFSYGHWSSAGSRTRITNLAPSPMPKASSPVSSGNFRNSTPTSSRRKKSKRGSELKLKHNDSQIQFATIESSPLGTDVLDSQLLTDRQREIRERQQMEAALFSGVHVNPKSRPKTNLEALKVSRDLAAGDADEPSTPDVTQDMNKFDNFIASSPTPRREAANELNNSVQDPPSSPPDGSLDKQSAGVPRMGTLKNVDEDEQSQDIWDVTSFPPTFDDVAASSGTPKQSGLSPSAHVSGLARLIGKSTFSRSASISNADVGIVRPSTPVKAQEHPAIEQATPKTPIDIFVDALSSPIPTPRHQVSSDNAYQDAMVESIQTLAHAHTTAEERLITTSPLSEMDEDSILRLMSKFDHAQEQDSTPIAGEKSDQEMSDSILADSELVNNTSRESFSERPEFPVEVVHANIRTNKITALRSSARLSRGSEASYTGPLSGSSKKRRTTITKEDMEVPKTTKKARLNQADSQPELNRKPGRPRKAISQMMIHQESEGVGGHEASDTCITDAQEKVHAVLGDGNEGEKTITLPLPRRVSQAEDSKGEENKVGTEASSTALSGESVIVRLEELLTGLKGTALSRDDAQRVDTLIWDLKREVCEAERRGRAS